MHYHQNILRILHIDSLETPSIPKEGTLEKDTAQDSHTMLITTLYFKTNLS